MGMFPPRLPHYFIQKFTEKGDVVLDPFSGRGTTALQACVEDRVGIGIDLNPLAYSLTAAKVKPPDLTELQNRVDDLSNDMFFAEIDDEPDQIKMLYHPNTLSQLVYLKQHLNPDNRVDAFLIGVLLGMLHGGALGKKNVKRKGTRPPTFLSIPMPNTFSMSVEYVRKYIREKELEAPDLDVFMCLRARLATLLREGFPAREGRAWFSRIQDIRQLPDPDIRKRRVNLIFSSPPYLKVLRYGLYNWIRLWFLGQCPDELDQNLDQHRKLEPYLDFMLDVCRLLYRVSATGAVCALVIGDVQKGKQEPILLAEEVWKYLKKKRIRWQLADIVEDKVPENKKVTKIWGDDKRGKATLVDRILVMYKKEYHEKTDHVTW
ncbi:MAG: DNA methyltransferase [Candidatus Sumerlaeia bacterium]